MEDFLLWLERPRGLPLGSLAAVGFDSELDFSELFVSVFSELPLAPSFDAPLLSLFDSPEEEASDDDFFA